MESLQEILNRKKIAPPDEAVTVKDYVLRRYKAQCSVKLQRGTLVISVNSSALAATLQMERQQLVDACNLGKQKLFIRTGR